MCDLNLIPILLFRNNILKLVQCMLAEHERAHVQACTHTHTHTHTHVHVQAHEETH